MFPIFFSFPRTTENEEELLNSPSESSRELRERANLQQLHLLTSAYGVATNTTPVSAAWTRTDWIRMYDTTSGQYYYHDTVHSKTSWTMPPPPPPPSDPTTTSVAKDNAGNNGTTTDASVEALVAQKQLKRKRGAPTSPNATRAKRTKRTKKNTTSFFCRTPKDSYNSNCVFSSTAAEYPSNSSACSGRNCFDDEDTDMKGPDTAIAMTICCCRKVRGKCLYTKEDLCKIGRAYDLDLTNMTREKQECELTSYYVEWHQREGTRYSDSLCFKGEHTKADRKRSKNVFTVSCIPLYK